MDPLSGLTEPLPVISAHLRIEQSTPWSAAAGVNVVIAEQQLCSDTSVPAGIPYETTDTPGGAVVSRAGAAVGG
jgi:hypothetical protein